MLNTWTVFEEKLVSSTNDMFICFLRCRSAELRKQSRSGAVGPGVTHGDPLQRRQAAGRKSKDKAKEGTQEEGNDDQGDERGGGGGEEEERGRRSETECSVGPR